MSEENCLRILKKTRKPIFYKKGRHGKPMLLKNKESAKQHFLLVDDGGVMEYDDRVEIWDYDEIDWLS